MQRILDQHGNEIVPLSPWYCRALDYLRPRYIVITAIIAGLAAVVSNIKTISTALPSSQANNRIDVKSEGAPIAATVAIENQDPVEKVEELLTSAKTLRSQLAMPAVSETLKLEMLQEALQQLAMAEPIISSLDNSAPTSNGNQRTLARLASERIKEADKIGLIVVDRFKHSLKSLNAVADEGQGDGEFTLASTATACQSSRLAWECVLMAHSHGLSNADQMAAELEVAQAKAINILSKCNCDLCTAVVASVRRRQQYVVTLRRQGTSHGITPQMKWLGREL